jgi:hypothetical protein
VPRQELPIRQELLDSELLDFDEADDLGATGDYTEADIDQELLDLD